jgi:uncharacterized membrane protein
LATTAGLGISGNNYVLHSFPIIKRASTMLPPIPDWNGLHPLVVHFPIALLLVAPLLILFSLIPGRFAQGLSLSALGLIVLGTIGAWVAVSTGEAAEDFAKGIAGAEPVLDRHEDLAEIARNAFTVLSLVYAGLVTTGIFVRKSLPKYLMPSLTGVFLVGYGAACIVLANAAHQGGRLVHEFGVRSPMATVTTDAVVAANKHHESERGEKDD